MIDLIGEAFGFLVDLGESTVEGASQLKSIIEAIINIYSSFFSFLPSPFDKILAAFIPIFILIYGFKIFKIVKGG